MKTTILFLSSICMLLSGCSITSITNPQLDMAKFLVGNVEQEKEIHLKKAKEFIYFAQNGLLKNMLENTSRYTIESSGIEKVKTVYSSQVIPSFQDSAVDWTLGGKVEISEAAKNKYLVGWTFSAEASGNQGFVFYISIFEEDGKYMVSQISRKK